MNVTVLLSAEAREKMEPGCEEKKRKGEDTRQRDGKDKCSRKTRRELNAFHVVTPSRRLLLLSIMSIMKQSCVMEREM